MPSFTPNYNWYLPGVGDPTDQDLWGGYLNSNLSDQDTVVKSISDSVAGKYSVSNPPPESVITFTDITTNNASTSKHGFLKKLSNVATEFMNGQGNWTTPTSFTESSTKIVFGSVTVQWGTTPVLSQAGVGVTFGTAFSGTAYAVFLTGMGSFSPTYAARAGSYTSVGFTGYDSTNQAASYLAIGPT